LCACFSCRKCKLNKNFSEQSNSQTGVCCRCVASYVSMTTRVKNNHSLRGYWEELSDADRVKWYVKQQQVPTGNKRPFDETMYHEGSERKLGEDNIDSDHFVPWWMFYERLRPLKPYDTIVAEWTDAVSKPGVTARWNEAHQEWLVCMWEGEYRNKVDSSAQYRRIGHSANVTSAEQAEAMIAAGSRALDEAATSSRSEFAYAPPCPKVPIVQSSSAEQPLQPQMMDIIGSAIRRDVHGTGNYRRDWMG
jgi:hypothetical protein